MTAAALSPEADNSRFRVCAIAQPREWPGRTLGMKEFLKTRPLSVPDDLQLSVLAGPGQTYQRSNVLLARAHLSGTLEFLTAAWGKLLGYEAHELAGKTLRHLMAIATPVSVRAIEAILDEVNLEPVDLNVRCRDGRIKGLKLHRRFDPHERSMYIVADETPGNHPDDRAMGLP